MFFSNVTMDNTERYLCVLNSVFAEGSAVEAPVNYLKCIYDIESFCEALFTKRNEIKQRIYGSIITTKAHLNQLTYMYDVIDKCFFQAFDYLSKNQIVKTGIIIDDRRFVEKFYTSVCGEIENGIDKNQQYLTKQEADSFYNCTLEGSSMDNELNTYKSQIRFCLII